jgi:hypothetical protein
MLTQQTEQCLRQIAKHFDPIYRQAYIVCSLSIVLLVFCQAHCNDGNIH